MDRILLIGEDQRRKIKKLVMYARANFCRLDRLKRITDGLEPPVGDLPNYSIEIPMGFRCVFSIEEQPIGMCKHLSISVDSPNKFPSPEAVNMLIEEFGFRGTVENLQNGHVFREETSINIIQIDRIPD